MEDMVSRRRGGWAGWRMGLFLLVAAEKHKEFLVVKCREEARQKNISCGMGF